MGMKFDKTNIHFRVKLGSIAKTFHVSLKKNS